MPHRKNSAIYPSLMFNSAAQRFHSFGIQNSAAIPILKNQGNGECFARLLNFFLPVKFRGVILALMQSICYKNHLIV